MLNLLNEAFVIFYIFHFVTDIRFITLKHKKG